MKSYPKSYPGTIIKILVAIGAMLAFQSCASFRPPYDSSLPKVTISKASESEIRAYGKNFSENPYMEPRTLARGKLNEFFIIMLDFNLPEKTSVSLVTYANSLSGEEVAKVYDEKTFKEFWWSNTIRDDDSGLWERKMTAIERVCIPSLQFSQPAGRTTLLIPLVGKNPIPRPANIYAQAALSTGEIVEYSFVLE